MLVSIIMPIYNTAAELLKCCIDSLLGQTYRELEVILVDDGSTDESGRICDEYAQKDSRVKVLHKPNGGEASARKAGLDLVTGEFVGFSDSDDEHPIDAISVLVGAFNSGVPVDLAVGAYLVKSGRMTRIAVADRAYYTAYDAVVAAGSDLGPYRDEFIFSTVNGKLFRSEIIKKHHLQFDEQMVVGNDTLFVRDFLSRCGNVQNVFVPTYIYYKYDMDQRVQGTAGVYLDRFLRVYHVRKKEIEFVRSHADHSVADLQRMYQRTMDRMIGSLILAAAYEEVFPYNLEKAVGKLIQTDLITQAIQCYKPIRANDNTLIPKYILEQDLQSLMEELRKSSETFITARGGKQSLTRMSYPHVNIGNLLP